MGRPSDSSNEAWPKRNDEEAVRQWLSGMMDATTDKREVASMVRWLLDEASGLTRGQRMMQRPFRFSESELNRLAMWGRDIQQGRPIQHVIGYTPFAGLRLAVGPQALIPRPETEELVSLALEDSDEMPSADVLRVLDIGTGSGCIALGVKHGLNLAGRASEVVGEDVSVDALRLAEQNAEANHLNVKFVERDALSSAADTNSYHLILSNPPYIPQREREMMDAVVTDHDPALALFVPDERPLLFYEAILKRCESTALASGGVVLLECHRDFVKDVSNVFCNSPEFAVVDHLFDMQNRLRFVRAFKQRL